MRKRALGLGAGLALVLVVGAGGWWLGNRSTADVTGAEARAYLDRIVAAARARDFDRLCGLNGSVHVCEQILAEFHLDRSVPSDPPTVVSTRYLHEGGGFVAGRVLVVEGTTPCGQRYHTEVFVFREDRSNLKAQNALYWSNFTITGDTTSPGGPSPPTC